MTARTPHMGNAAASEVLTAANYNKNAAGWLGYVTSSATQTGIGASDTDVTGLSESVTVPANRLLKISAHIEVVQQTGTGTVLAYIKEGGTTIGQIARNTYGASERGVIEGSTLVVAPSAGAHTYKVTVATSADTVDTTADATVPNFLLIEDLGSV